MKHEKVLPFRDLLKDNFEIVEILEKNGFKNPTPIQSKALDFALSTQDLMIQAPTGSGKTLIYALKIILEYLKKKNLCILLT